MNLRAAERLDGTVDIDGLDESSGGILISGQGGPRRSSPAVPTFSGADPGSKQGGKGSGQGRRPSSGGETPSGPSG